MHYEIFKVGWRLVKNFVCKEKNFKYYSKFNREPMKIIPIRKNYSSPVLK